MPQLLTPQTRTITSSRALEIAEADGIQMYDDLSKYRIEIRLEENCWFVEYRIKTPRVAGGGPHYIIDARTGEIVSKKYYQ